MLLDSGGPLRVRGWEIVYDGPVSNPEGKMPVNLLIENVPDELVERLQRRAARSGRSLEDELMDILVEAVGLSWQGISIEEARLRLRALGLRMPSESAAMVREDRDSR